MKNIIILFFVLSIPMLIHAQKNKLVGQWEVVTVDGEAPSERESSLQLTIYKDGSIRLEENGRIEEFSWDLSEDKSSLFVVVNGERKEELKIVELKKKEMSLDNQGSVAVFTKVGKARKKKFKLKGIAKKMVGNWAVVAIGERELDDAEKKEKAYIQFNKDGSVWTSAPGPNIGKWKLSEDQKEIIITITSRSAESSEFELSKDGSVLTVHDDGTKIRLERQKTKMDKPKPAEEEPYMEPDISERELEEPLPPNAVSVEAALIVGNWKVAQIDVDSLEGREIQFIIREDGSFEIKEDGETARKGEWDLNKSNTTLTIKDQNNSSNSYTILGADADTFRFSDSYGTYILKR